MSLIFCSFILPFALSDSLLLPRKSPEAGALRSQAPLAPPSRSPPVQWRLRPAPAARGWSAPPASERVCAPGCAVEAGEEGRAMLPALPPPPPPAPAHCGALEGPHPTTKLGTHNSDSRKAGESTASPSLASGVALRLPSRAFCSPDGDVLPHPQGEGLSGRLSRRLGQSTRASAAPAPGALAPGRRPPPPSPRAPEPEPDLAPPFVRGGAASGSHPRGGCRKGSGFQARWAQRRAGGKES